jgi:hypothetical protein
MSKWTLGEESAGFQARMVLNRKRNDQDLKDEVFEWASK